MRPLTQPLSFSLFAFHFAPLSRPSSTSRKGNILVATPIRTPTPRLSKSAQMRLKAENLKKAKVQGKS